MTKPDYWQERYRTGNSPWDIGRPDANLTEMVEKRPIPSCKALDVGCGTGDNAVWLARRGFTVTGTDFTQIAIQKAQENAAQAGVSCTFLRSDFMGQKIPGAPFGFIFDRGCFHMFDSDQERAELAQNVAAHLETGGLWLSILGSADDPPRDPGPPQRTARDIVVAAEPYFEILSLKSGHFDSNRSRPPRAWVCLMQKRDKPG
ncbi:MAG: class I SAM-dependent methyltransferase [Deltaproteobacteria bacterium]|nr:class I SAM-dependent methyltransferase [Deltaproteobacteria bacterium]